MSSKRVPRSLEVKRPSPGGGLPAAGGIANVAQVNGKGSCFLQNLFRGFLETQADSCPFVGPQVCFHLLTADENAVPIAMGRVYFYEATGCEARGADWVRVMCKRHYSLFVGYL